MKTKMNIKSIGIAAAVFIAFSGYYLATYDTGSSIGNTTGQIGVNRLRSTTKSTSLKVEEVSKTEIYTQELKNQEDKKRDLERIQKDKNPESLTASIKNVFKSEEDKKIDELSSSRVTPTYKGKSYTAAEENATRIYSAAVSNSPAGSSPSRSSKSTPSGSAPTNRKSELSSKSEVESSLFHTADFNQQIEAQGADLPTSSTVVKAVVFGNHTVKSGGLVRFRFIEDAYFNGHKFARNTVFYGKASFGQDRLLIKVDRLPKGKSFESIVLAMHDQDLLEGIHAPVDLSKEVAVDEAMGGVEDMLSSSGSVYGQLGGGAARVFSTVVNGNQKVELIDAYPVTFLLVEKN